MLRGPHRTVLQACKELAGTEPIYIRDDALAGKTGLSVQDVRNSLVSLEGERLVDLVRKMDHFEALISPDGNLYLSQRRPFPDDSDPTPEEWRPIKVVTKGLRSYDKNDAGFFLDLLPPPRRADGLPEIIHFWKVRIEEPEPDTMFRIGVIYGPSGCGKSSLVKAGLLPWLSDPVLRIYIEATPDQTESDLLKGIRWKCPDLPPELGLVETLAALHDGGGLPLGRKLLLVLDQFEQWLVANRGREDTDLVKALGHCDEERVRAILMVRDDFLAATIHFMEEIGIELRSFHNARRAELFTPHHAEKVLASFGRADGRLRDCLTTEQQEFITQAVKALALQDGMIIPVRLALFFETFKSREWTTKTLQEIGDAEGVGVAFLERTFNSDYADPILRSHQEAAQSVLGALLPEGGSEIKRPRRPWRELLDASGYASRPKLFDQLLRILDKELFLITPIDQGGRLESDGGQATGSVERYYQLTHDYLVPSLREWRSNKNQEALNLVNAIRLAETKDVPPLVKQLAGLRLWANPLLRRIMESSGEASKERLHASLALLPVDQEQVEFLYRRLLEAAPTELPVLRNVLRPFRERLIGRLWNVLEQSDDKSQYLQAASALALYDPANSRWQTIGGKVARAMVTGNAAHLGFWLDALRPARDKLTPPLATIYRDTERPERSLAFNILEDYASDQPNVLSNLLMDSEKDHFTVLFKKLKAHQEVVVPLLKEEMVKSLPEATEVEKDGLAKRQARAAIALVRLGQANEVWPKLQHKPDPRLRSFIVNWMAPLGVNPQQIASELVLIKPVPRPTPAEGQQTMDAILFNPENSERRALILALGGYDPDELSPDKREPLVEHLLEMYRNDPDAGIHGAAEWMLRRWKQKDKLAAIDVELKKLKDRGNRRWYVNSEGQTLAVIEGPIEFMMGSPNSEPDRRDSENLHRKRINRRFAVATKEVTVEQYQRFLKENPEIAPLEIDRYSPEPTGPMNGITWYEAAAYCNWLSEQEHLKPCYEPILEGILEGEYAEGMKILPDALKLPGYRLPTEAEWEYACRAGAVTSRYYGRSVELLGKYAWYSQNSQDRAWPCGQLLPNELGLFDMLGNMHEWCQEQYYRCPEGEGNTTTDDMNILLSINEKNPRLLRGGTFVNPPAVVRSAFRGRYAPSNRSISLGFRLARTYH